MTSPSTGTFSPRAHDHGLADPHLGDRHFDLGPVALDPGFFGSEAGQLPDGAACALGGEMLDVIGEPHEEHDDDRGRPSAREHGGAEADRHEGVRGHPPPERGAQDGTEDRVAAEEDRREPERPCDKPGQPVQETGPFGEDHEPDDSPQGRAEGGEQTGREAGHRVLQRRVARGRNGAAAVAAPACRGVGGVVARSFAQHGSASARGAGIGATPRAVPAGPASGKRSATAPPGSRRSRGRALGSGVAVRCVTPACFWAPMRRAGVFGAIHETVRRGGDERPDGFAPSGTEHGGDDFFDVLHRKVPSVPLSVDEKSRR